MLPAVLLCLALSTGGQPIELDLWPDGTPGAPVDPPAETVTDRPEGGDRRVAGVHRPTITVYPAERAEGAGPAPAVVICPGGGYARLALDKEGHDVARFLAERGFAGVVLKYRLPRPDGHEYGHEAPLADARRALELVRAHSADWGIDAERVGILGFSAGGHLAGSASVQLDEARPDFTVLVYPVMSMQPDIAHRGSLRNLLGSEPSDELRARFSNELRVDADTPPAFLVHTYDDFVSIDGSLRYAAALRAAGVPVELHAFERGGHGYAMRLPDLPVGVWPDLLVAWLENRFG